MKNPKPVSEKTIQKANKFLGEYNLTAEQLTKPQKESLIKYIREKRVQKWNVLIAVVFIIFYVAVSFYYVPLLKSLVGNFAPDFVKVSDDGRERYIQLGEMEKEHAVSYGWMCAIMGFALGGFTAFMFLGAANIMVSSISHLRDKKKIFEAFLPSIKPTSASDYSSNI